MPPTAKVGTGEAVAPPAPARRCTVRINCSKTKNLMPTVVCFGIAPRSIPCTARTPPPPSARFRASPATPSSPRSPGISASRLPSVYTNEVATLAHPPAMQSPPRAFLGEHRHQPRFHRLVRRCVYRRDGRGGGEAGGEAAVQSEGAVKRSIAEHSGEAVALARSACMVTLSVSTGCNTMLTSVPATAPATAFAVVTRPPPPERPRSSSRVDARLARGSWSSDAGEAPSCRERIGAALARPTQSCPRAFAERWDAGGWVAGDDGGGERRWEGQLEGDDRDDRRCSKRGRVPNRREREDAPVEEPAPGHSFRCPRCAREIPWGPSCALPRDQGRSRSRRGRQQRRHSRGFERRERTLPANRCFT